MQAQRRGARHFQHRDHQRDDRDIFGEMPVRADRAAQRGTAGVAEVGEVSAAQHDHVDGERCIDQCEHGKIGGGDAWPGHVVSPNA